MKLSLEKVVLILSLVLSLHAQTQTDIPWQSLADSDWPMIKHDPQFTGRSPYKGPQTPIIVWTADLEDGVFSGPVIGEAGNLYFGSYYQDPSFNGLSDYFYSYFPVGKFRWDYKLGRNRPPQTGIVIDSNNTIYFGSLDGYFYALNSDGTLKWEYDTEGPIFEVTMPNIDLEGNIYITNDNGYLFSITPQGELKWKVKYNEGFFGRTPVFSPDGETLYIAGGDSCLYAINLDSSLKWKFECGVIQRAPMVDSQGNIYFLPNQLPQFFHSLFDNGDIRWKYEIQNLGPFDSFSIPTIDYEGNIYVIAVDTVHAPSRLLLSLNYAGKLRWKYIFDNEYEDIRQPIICDSEGTVYVGSTWGYYYYAISNEGELKWKLPLNDYQVDNTGAIAEDGTLYLGVHKNSLFTGFEKTLIAIRDTGVASLKDEESPTEFTLHQNYPNPFNPTTSIEYQVASTEKVSIKVYDVLGREIRTLVNEQKSPGSYSVNFDASNLSSGIYFYVLEAGNVRLSKKMMLIK